MKGRMEFPVFGTTGVLVVADDARLYEARQAVDDVLGRVDQTCSRFRPDSDLERVNAGAGRAVAADPLLLDAVDVALRAARRTGGAVDPTIGQALRVLGYDRDFASLEVGGPTTTVRIVPVAGWRQVMVDRTAGTVRVPAGTRLDLGATAKAWAADRAAGAACRRAGCGVLLSLGGDMAVAGPAPAGGWNVQLSDWCGEDLDGASAVVLIMDGGLATSGTTARRWQAGDQQVHHIIDPATSQPAATPWRTVTVAAGSCLDANVAATAALVMGDAAPSWLAERHLPAHLVAQDGAVTYVAGWPADMAAAA